MQIEKYIKDSFCVIGKVGSTDDGEGFIQRLWNDANSHFDEVSALAARNENGDLVGVWGAMTNFAFEFAPWEDNFSKGLYLAGIEAREDAFAPAGWKKWIVPGFEYLKVKCEDGDTFPKMIAYMKENGIPLVGAVQDFTDPGTGDSYMLFPVACNDSKDRMIRRIKDTQDPVSVCTHNCELCFLSQWCGGCRTACNMCSYATVSDDNVCENVRCAESRGLRNCGHCPDLAGCRKGYYGKEDGFVPKATALFVSRHGEEKYLAMLNKAVGAGMKYADDLYAAGSAEKALELLEAYI